MKKRSNGRIYAMKVMRKAHVVERNQAEYMKTEARRQSRRRRPPVP